MSTNGQAAPVGGRTGCSEQVSAIGKMIVESQTLDEDGKEMTAYRSYLGTVQYIMQYLAADITTNQARGSLPGQTAAKLFKMAKHCLERAEGMYATAQEEGRVLASNDPTPSTLNGPQHLRCANSSAASAPSSTIPIPSTNTLPLPGPQERSHSVPPGGSGGVSPTAVRHLHSVGASYMHEARRKNQYMMEQYKAHLRQTSSQMLPSSQEMGLSMLRRLEENISVAKIRQQNLARKARERQLRLQQTESKAVPERTQVARLSQLSVEDLRKQVASFEHGKHFPILTALKNKIKAEGQERLENLRNRITSGSVALPSSPPSSSTVSTATEVYNFVNEILSNPDHPLSRLLGEYQMEVFTLLKSIQSAREKVGDFPKLYISRKEDGEGKSKEECTEKCWTSSSHQAPHTSPPVASSHPPTFPSPHPPTVTVHPPINRDPSHLDLFYEGEDEDDDLFLLSDGGNLPPGDPNFNKDPLKSTHSRDQVEVDDKLERLRRELEQEIKERSPTCEDGGRLYTCVHEVLEEGGAYERRGRSVTPIRTVGEEGEASEDGGRCVTDDGGVSENEGLGEEGGVCEDGGKCVTQLLVVREGGVPDGARQSANDSFAHEDNGSGIDRGRDTTTIPTPHYKDLYTDADALARHLQKHKEEQLSVPQDLPDGGMLSRPQPPPPPADTEEEEEVVFPGLVPLSCRCYYGDEEKMKELKQNAEAVLTQAVSIIRSSLEKLEQVFLSCYPSLATPTEKEECQSVLESLFFPALLPPLLAAYRCKHYFEEVATARNMCRHVNATPKDLDVRKKFWLQEQPSVPYKEAIDELSKVSSLHCPSVKLTCLVSTSRLLVQCIDDYCEAQGQPKGAIDSEVGVDDILPIMSYVIIRSGMPQLVSETALMDDFIQDGYVKGEEGFCLTSFLTALKFVSHMSS